MGSSDAEDSARLRGGALRVTVLVTDMKGSMELLADRDPEEARKILDPVRFCPEQAEAELRALT